MNKIRIPALALSAALGVALLAACSPSTNQAEPTSPATAPTVVAAVEAPAATVAASAKPNDQDETDGPTYPLADGTDVQIDPNKPLPKAVVKDVTASAVSHQITGEGSGVATETGTRELARVIARQTGRNVLIVTVAQGSVGGGPEGTVYLTVGSQRAVIRATYDHDEQVAAARAFITRQADPTSWELIVSA
ncbi:MAG: hypothetical protein NVV66_16275 [Cellulomonas sp.]|uniref:hypothetical protein n=1 Tax=Cellulomonas sp. TaxID=40001 RepID=UPI002584B21E|nr:hypothetical protein [Cellulomonas sp.]MCR6706174.1 hypothetical protein [Cellulomonas sp.]